MFRYNKCMTCKYYHVYGRVDEDDIPIPECDAFHYRS